MALLQITGSPGPARSAPSGWGSQPAGGEVADPVLAS